MAREAVVTQEQVNAAANAIRASGGKPTARAVREHVGVGSMATILKFLQMWQAGQIKPAIQDVTLPPGLQRLLLDFVAQEIAAARVLLEADLVAARQAQADLIAESERQSATIEAQAAALESLQAEKAALMGRLGQMELDLAAARDEADSEGLAAEVARTELAKTQLRLETIPRLEAEVERLRIVLQDEQQGRQQALQVGAVLEAKLEASERRAGEILARSGEVEKQLQALNRELSNANVAVQAGQARLEAVARELEDAKQAASDARSAAKKAGEGAAELRGRLAAANKVGKSTLK